MAYKKKFSKPVVVHNHITTGSSNTKRVLLIVIALLLAVFVVVGAVALFNKSSSKNEIKYKDNPFENFVVFEGEDGTINVEQNSKENNDVYFAGAEENFIKFKQLRTWSKHLLFFTTNYTTYEISMSFYENEECTELVQYVISLSEDFGIYQIVEIRGLEQEYYSYCEENSILYASLFDENATIYLSFEPSLANDTFSQYVKDFEEKYLEICRDIKSFNFPENLYFYDGTYRMQLSSEYSLLKVFTTMCRTFAGTYSEEDENTILSFDMDLKNFCSFKIFNEETGEFANVTNSVILETELQKLVRPWDEILLISDIAATGVMVHQKFITGYTIEDYFILIKY